MNGIMPRRSLREFADRVRQASAVLTERLAPPPSERVVTRADAALAGQVALLGYGLVNVGDPVDWHRDAVAGIRAPQRHWSRIRYLDAAVSAH